MGIKYSEQNKVMKNLRYLKRYIWNEEMRKWENEINMNKINYCMSLLFFLTVNLLMGKSIYLSIYK